MNRLGLRGWVLAGLAAGMATLGIGCSYGPGDDPALKGGGSGAGAASAEPVKGPIKILFVTNSNADWWNAVEKGMQDGGKEFDVQVMMRRNEGKAQGQIDRLQEALGLKDVQGVAVSVIEADAPGVIDAMKALQAAGKVVITIDSDVAADSTEVRSGYIGTNNVKAGEVAGRAAKAVRPQGGKVAVFVGTSGAANARERKEGFFKGAGEAFQEIETFDDGGDHSRARDNVQTALGKYSDLDTLLGLWSYNAPAIAEEVSKNPAVRKKTSVVTFDLDEKAVDEVVAGNIDVTVCQNPYEMGRQGVKLLKALLQKDDAAVKEVLPDGKARDTGVRVIVPKADSPVMQAKDAVGGEVITIEEMKSWLASKGLKSS